MKSKPPIDLGITGLIESCQKIQINDLLRICRHDIKHILLKSEIKALGLRIELVESKTGFGGIRLWFKCPICQGRRGILFQQPTSKILGCRQCLGLKYRKQRYKNMLESKVKT